VSRRSRWQVSGRDSPGKAVGTSTSTFVVVGTGVDPVTSRFSGARSTN
jgi:hypothetical protein